jgi:hypothetical protein
VTSWLRRRWLVASLLLFALVIAVGTYSIADTALYPQSPTRIVVTANTIDAFDNRDPSRMRFGALEFRGGLQLNSKTRYFGGISGLYVEPDGNRFVAVTDHGAWLRGRIVYENGRPAGLADAEMAPLLGWDGKPLGARGWFDAESLTERDGQLYVGFERVNQIVRYNYGRDGLAARGEAIAVPEEFKTFEFNKSLECVAAPAAGSPLAGQIIMVTEHSLDAQGNHRSFLLGGDKVVHFSVKRSGDFDISDCTILPPGDLLLLERSFSPARGVAMRIRRIALAAIKADALVDGAELISADLGYQIDNMEGIAVHRNAAGETIITLVSDDNFSIIQRNLLLQFAIVE